MPIPLPDLDDRSYQDLLEEALAQIPTLYPTWTDHNPSDAGITLVELLAWLTDMLIYRLNRIPEQNYRVFLQLLNGDQPLSDDLTTAIRQTITELNQIYRAVTPADYEYLASQKWTQEARPPDLPLVHRAKCVPGANLRLPGSYRVQENAPGHVSVIIVPDSRDDPYPTASPELCHSVWAYLDERRMLTVNHHVVAAHYIPLRLEMTVYALPDVIARQLIDPIQKQVRAFYSPLRGGEDGKGWAFGRGVNASELYALLESIAGVDYVEKIIMTTDDPERITIDHSARQQVRLWLYPNELVRIEDVRINACDAR